MIGVKNISNPFEKIISDAQIVELDVKYASELEKLERETFNIPWTKKQFQESFDLSNYVFLGAISEKLIGYIGMYIVCDEAFITRIAVNIDYRNCKLGTILLNKIINISKNRKISKIFLEVRESNKAAISLYENAGFICDGKRANFYTNPNEDALLYSLKIKR